MRCLQSCKQALLACHAEPAAGSSAEAQAQQANGSAAAMQSEDDSDSENLGAGEGDKGTGQAAKAEGSHQPAVLSVSAAPDGSDSALLQEPHSPPHSPHSLLVVDTSNLQASQLVVGPLPDRCAEVLFVNLAK